MCKKLIAIAASCAIILSLTSCNVNVKDYSSNPDTEVAGSLTTSDTASYTDDEKIIGYDIYRPGDENSSANSDGSLTSSSESTASSSLTSGSSSVVSGNNSSKSASSQTTSSDKTSSKTSSGDNNSSKTSSDKTSSDSTSSYYDDWEGDNVIDFSELLEGYNP